MNNSNDRIYNNDRTEDLPTNDTNGRSFHSAGMGSFDGKPESGQGEVYSEMAMYSIETWFEDRQDGEGSGIQNDFTEAMEQDLEEFMNDIDLALQDGNGSNNIYNEHITNADAPELAFGRDEESTGCTENAIHAWLRNIQGDHEVTIEGPITDTMAEDIEEFDNDIQSALQGWTREGEINNQTSADEQPMYDYDDDIDA